MTQTGPCRDDADVAAVGAVDRRSKRGLEESFETPAAGLYHKL
jgi:hypothetical protein